MIITPIITTPYLSRVLNADGIGIVSFAESIVSYFMLFAALGVGIYGQREISYYQDNRLKRSDLNLNSSMNYRISKNSYKDDKLNDICSFLPEVQRESDSFHKKFCELMNYIETNIEGSIN